MWVLSLPLARVSAPDQQRRGRVEAWARPGVGADEEGDALGVGEAADEQQRRPLREHLERDVAVAHPGAGLVAAPGVVNQPSPQECTPFTRWEPTKAR